MRYVVIGASAAGISCIEAIREIDKSSKITLIGDEKVPLYSKCLLGYYLAGTINEGNLFFKKRNFFDENCVEAILGVRAERLDLKNKTVTTSAKERIPFDKLLIATGARTKMPEIPGVEKYGIYGLRTIRDARHIDVALKKTRTALVLGGGLVGLRASHALNSRGAIVKIVMEESHILSGILEPQTAGLIEKKMEGLGIGLVRESRVKEVFGGHNVKAVLLNDGVKLDCELVVIGNESELNADLAKEAGIDVRRGIVVNGYLETSAKDVFAAGDVSETPEVSSGKTLLNAVWPCALEQGRVAGENMAGRQVDYDGLRTEYSLEFFGLSVTTRGSIREENGTIRVRDI